MPQIRAKASAAIDAPPQRVYSIIADYHEGHPKILPRQYFPSLDVERGGIGAGTVIRFQMRTLGTTRTARAEITEPDPGRMLVETIPETGLVTTFTVEPMDGGERSFVTITTEWRSHGVKAMVERLVAPRSSAMR